MTLVGFMTHGEHLGARGGFLDLVALMWAGWDLRAARWRATTTCWSSCWWETVMWGKGRSWTACRTDLPRVHTPTAAVSPAPLSGVIHTPKTFSTRLWVQVQHHSQGLFIHKKHAQVLYFSTKLWVQLLHQCWGLYTKCTLQESSTTVRVYSYINNVLEKASCQAPLSGFIHTPETFFTRLWVHVQHHYQGLCTNHSLHMVVGSSPASQSGSIHVWCFVNGTPGECDWSAGKWLITHINNYF